MTSQPTQEAFLQQFIATLSHEFRTPLASLTASLEIFWSEADHLSRGEIRALLGSLRLSVTNLQTLVDNLLDSASIQADQFVVRPQPEALDTLIAAAVAVMQPLLDRRGQTLTYTRPFDLPPVLADSARIRQVFVNLLMNASKYSPPESVIEIQAEKRSADAVRVGIADSGHGIPEAMQADIFAPFTRLEQEQSGLGVGLAVVKTIVEAHGGRVGVENRAGGGAVFWFTLMGVTDENPGC